MADAEEVQASLFVAPPSEVQVLREENAALRDTEAYLREKIEELQEYQGKEGQVIVQLKLAIDELEKRALPASLHPRQVESLQRKAKHMMA